MSVPKPNLPSLGNVINTCNPGRAKTACDIIDKKEKLFEQFDMGLTWKFFWTQAKNEDPPQEFGGNRRLINTEPLISFITGQLEASISLFG